MAGIAIGVMALIVVLSVMNGFENDIQAKILGTQSHIVISSIKGGIENPDATLNMVLKEKGVVAATPFILSQGLVSAQGGISGVVIRGINPESASKVIRLKDIITRGTFALDASGVLIGTELASNLGVGIGDAITLISPNGTITPLGMIPTSMTFLVRGIFSTGMYEFDSNMVYISLETAKKLFMVQMPSGIEIKVDDIYAADSISRGIVRHLDDGYWAKTWKDMNRSLFSALKLEKTIMFIILMFIILVAAFSIISTLIMLVMEKRKDIAILKSMGATTEQILRIFMTMGLTIGLTGSLMGLILGLLLTNNLNAVVAGVEFIFKIEVMPKDVYYITGLPTKIKPLEVTLITITSFLLSFFATIYPARQAAKQDPVEIIRYE